MSKAVGKHKNSNLGLLLFKHEAWWCWEGHMVSLEQKGQMRPSLGGSGSAALGSCSSLVLWQIGSIMWNKVLLGSLGAASDASLSSKADCIFRQSSLAHFAHLCYQDSHILILW